MSGAETQASVVRVDPLPTRQTILDRQHGVRYGHPLLWLCTVFAPEACANWALAPTVGGWRVLLLYHIFSGWPLAPQWQGRKVVGWVGWWRILVPP